MDQQRFEPPMTDYGYDNVGASSRDMTAPKWRGALSSESSTTTTTTDKKTERRDRLDSLFANVNRDLLVSKSFYFLFFGACGSLFPLISIYFKQLAMTPAQAGALLGVRPIVEVLAAPLWGAVVARYHRAKSVLLFALFCWVAFTLALAFIQPTARACLTHNSTHLVLAQPWKHHEGIGGYGNGIPAALPAAAPADQDDLEGEELLPVTARGGAEEGSGAEENPAPPPPPAPFHPLHYTTLNEALPPQHRTVTALGKSPLPLPPILLAPRTEHLAGIDDLVSPPFSSAVFEASDVRAVFFMLLILTVLGEALGAPAVMLADTATLAYLGPRRRAHYGRQRMWGSLGWAVAMFLVGMALDRASLFRQHPCGERQSVERNYTICFAVFSVLMSCAFLAATQFRFRSDIGDDRIALDDLTEDDDVKAQQQQQEQEQEQEQQQQQQKQQQQQQQEQQQQQGERNGKPTDLHISLDDGAAPASAVDDAAPAQGPSTFVPRATLLGSRAEWRAALRLFAAPRHALVLYVTWFMGFAVGLVFTFLFWHLQDLGGTPTLFGIASVINHASEIVAYFLTGQLIQAIGHIRVLYLGLLGNIARFLYISYLRDPWWVLPFEFFTGLTHAAVWAACCSYVAQATLEPYRATTQIVMQSVHHGLGRGCGSIVGGVLVYYFGTEYVFRGYGIACVVVLVAIAGLHFIYVRHVGAGPGAAHDPHRMLEETAHLAPCGVPMSVSRNLSSSKLDDLGDAGGNGVKGADDSQTRRRTTSNGYLGPNTMAPAYTGERRYLGPNTMAPGYTGSYQSDPSYGYGAASDVPLPAPIKPPPSKGTGGRRPRQIYQGDASNSGLPPGHAPMPTTEPYLMQPETRGDFRTDEPW